MSSESSCRIQECHKAIRMSFDLFSMLDRPGFGGTTDQIPESVAVELYCNSSTGLGETAMSVSSAFGCPKKDVPRQL